MKLRLLFIPLLGLLSACSEKGSPLGPTVPTVPVGGGIGITSLTFVGGGTGQPVSGAAINAAGNATKTTDSAGHVAFDQAVPVGGAYDAVASAHLPRLSFIRSLTDVQFSMWPVGPGFDEAFVNELVYNEYVPGRRLSRPVVSTVYLRLSPEIANDPGAANAHHQAAATLTTATESKIAYIISDNPPMGASVYDMVIGDTQGNRALTYNKFTGNMITGNRIVYFSLDIARVFYTVAHELGHTLGLGHDDSTNSGLMGTRTARLHTDFSDAEKLAIKMMFQRFPGTEWPDNDRNAQAMSGFRGTITISCGH